MHTAATVYIWIIKVVYSSIKSMQNPYNIGKMFKVYEKNFFSKKVQLQGLLNDFLDGSAGNLVVWLRK